MMGRGVARGGGLGPVLLLVALAGGLLSFFSPCVWPLYPAYVAQVTAAGGRAAAGAALFSLGFSAVFVALGASASEVGQWLHAYHLPLEKVAGAVIVLFGLALAGILPESWLGQPRGLAVGPRAPGAGTALLLGMAFAFGWTPCVGPILASILALAGSGRSLGAGLALLSAYSLGFALPFLALACAASRGARLPGGVARFLPAARRAGGVLLSALGVLVFSGGLSSISSFLYARI
jgi:cytochrome c-type biogenesis protein